MKISRKIGILILIIILIAGGIFLNPFKNSQADDQPATQAATSGNLSNIITASGDVEAENQASLTFLTSGRVAFIGVKKGDSVTKGQILANLDTTIASHSVTAADAQYRSAKAALDKVIDDIHLFQYGNGGEGNIGTSNETQTQKTQRQQAEEAANVAYDNLQSAQKQLELQSILAPFDGKVLAVTNIAEETNVSPTSGSTIVVSGGGALKFVADISDQDITRLHEGQAVTIKLDGDNAKAYSGTISKIADGKTTLADGRNVIKVDIQSPDLQTSTQAGQTGSVEISVDQNRTIIIPAWLVVANKYVWVLSNNQAVLKAVTVGQTVSGKTSITSGLDQNDQVILNPQIIAKAKYTLL